jgi:hypothetical protein
MTALASSAITIRLAVESDVALIYSSWLRSYWNATVCHQGIEYQAYQAGQRARIERLLQARTALVACSPEAPDTIMGWLSWGGAGVDHTWALNYVYVRHIYRRSGVARLLTRGYVWAATHMTPAFARAFPSIPFNPYLLELT